MVLIDFLYISTHPNLDLRLHGIIGTPFLQEVRNTQTLFFKTTTDLSCQDIQGRYLSHLCLDYDYGHMRLDCWVFLCQPFTMLSFVGKLDLSWIRE